MCYNSFLFRDQEVRDWGRGRRSEILEQSDKFCALAGAFQKSYTKVTA